MKIFINYRREDVANIAFTISNSLKSEFGAANVFFDREKIPLDSSFPKEIDKALDDCIIFIPIIGKNWLRILKERQTENEEDFVLNEIDRALIKGISVIPVLIDDTLMPSKKELPSNVKSLAEKQAFSIATDPKRLPNDMDNFVIKLRGVYNKNGCWSKLRRVSKMNAFKYGSYLLLIGLAIFLVIKFSVNKSSVPDKELEKIDLNQLRNKIMFFAADIQSDPLAKSIFYHDSLRKYVLYGNKYVLPNRSEFDVDLAVGNLLYGISMIFKSLKNESLSDKILESAYEHLELSYELEKELWKKDEDKLAFDYFRGLTMSGQKNNLKDIKILRQIQEHALKIIDLSTNAEQPKTIVPNNTDWKYSVDQIVDFFNSYMLNEKYYIKDAVGAAEILLENSGGRVDGPQVIYKSENIYIVRYRGVGPNKVTQNMDWSVNMETKIIEPITEAAEVLTKSIQSVK